MSRITAFLPCRAGSQRVVNKNTRPFAGNPDGLLGVKLEQLVACSDIDRVLVSTNDPIVVEIVERYAQRNDKIAIDHRPDHLCSSSTSTDEVINYVPSVIEDGSVLWTHVTSPLVDADEYARMIGRYCEAEAAGTHDSLVSVVTLRTFLWNDEGPINYERAVEKWPRTQTLPSLYIINSAAFLIASNLIAETGDRVGQRPLFYDMDEIVAFDVDWEAQFPIAETLYRQRFAES